MTTKTISMLAGTASIVCLMLGWSAAAQEVNDSPMEENWWPTEWGADDKVGAPNRTTPEMVLEAVKLVKQGKVATLGKLYAPDIPFFGARGWKMIIPGTPTGGPLGAEQVMFHDELVITELGQVGTQFDGPGHIGVQTSEGAMFYNNRNNVDAYQRGPANMIAGMGDLGVEWVAEKGFVCRGVLLDAAKYHGMDRLPVPDSPDSPGVITADDVEAIIEQQGLDPIKEGDCVFIHTGHGDLWKNAEWKDLDAEEKRRRAAEFNSGEPGFGISACEYLAERKIILTGGDTFATEAIPGENPDSVIPCHAFLQTRHGIWNIENLEFTQLIEDGVYEFLYVWAPLKMVGATGSPGNPVALY